ncbi:MAG: glutamate decarboxylase [Solirubrobacteraceae bacterium]|nr:glutamate decarboxylase [Solirubrobacteraceae bacterium]
MPLHRTPSGTDALTVNPLFASAGMDAIPKERLPDGPMDPDVAYQVVHDELLLDGNARQNLATFVTTWMEPQARRLLDECSDKNMIDRDEYPQTAELESRCVKMLGRLWHAPGEAVGCSTLGSSEACMLGGLALKRRWQARGGTGTPNLVMGANVQVVWEKFCGYWDVEPRYVPMEGDRFHMDAAGAAALCDDSTIGVVAILGSTFDGSYEPVKEICAAIPDTVPVHVDAASGGFVAPFLDSDLEWDFRLDKVASINASGHKFGLVSPGVGWVLWRDEAALPKELVYNVDYLGGNMPTFTLNFSRPGSQVVAQYYTFIRLGFEGYRAVQQECRDVAQHLAAGLGRLGVFDVLTDGSELPVLALALAPDVANYTVYDVSERLRSRGWIVPAYRFPKNREDLHVLRIVVRNGFSCDLADLLLTDFERQLEKLGRQTQPIADAEASFHH